LPLDAVEGAALLFALLFALGGDGQLLSVDLDVDVLGLHAGDVHADFDGGVSFGEIQMRDGAGGGEAAEPAFGLVAEEAGAEIVHFGAEHSEGIATPERASAIVTTRSKLTSHDFPPFMLAKADASRCGC
jgi:hypothetical protein